MISCSFLFILKEKHLEYQIEKHNEVKKQKLWMPGILGALLLPFSTIGLGSLLYPHVEVIGTSLVAIGILLLVLRWSGSQSDRKWRIAHYHFPKCGVQADG
jgi:hypothetical protein